MSNIHGLYPDLFIWKLRFCLKQNENTIALATFQELPDKWEILVQWVNLACLELQVRQVSPDWRAIEVNQEIKVQWVCPDHQVLGGHQVPLEVQDQRVIKVHKGHKELKDLLVILVQLEKVEVPEIWDQLEVRDFRGLLVHPAFKETPDLLGRLVRPVQEELQVHQETLDQRGPKASPDFQDLTDYLVSYSCLW